MKKVVFVVAVALLSVGAYARDYVTPQAARWTGSMMARVPSARPSPRTGRPRTSSRTSASSRSGWTLASGLRSAAAKTRD